MPLAELLRPQTLAEVVGQAHLIGENKPLNLAIQHKTVPSMILWGAPGIGKTTLARLLAQEAHKPFYGLSAVSAGKAELRAIVEEARANNTQAILFLDEIHRFNKAQQDYLLPYVEDGTLTLIGATTENPSFEVIGALLSRVQVYVLKPLTPEEIATILQRGAVYLGVKMSQEAVAFLSEWANGDARSALNLLENVARLHEGVKELALSHMHETLQSKALRYDKTGEEHYNTISAFIKSMRAGQVDAALYYLARMVDAGEDPKFIARRMVIFASEDIGMAQPTALVVANEVFRAVEIIGLPEAQINLAHGVAYLALANKDRSAYDAYFAALDDVKKHGNLEIPLFLRNAPTKLMKELGYGKGDKESFLPSKLKGKKYYRRGENS